MIIIHLLDIFAVVFLLSTYFPPEPLISFVFSVLLHEGGHLFTVKLLALKIEKIGIRPFRAIIEIEQSESTLKQLFVILSGPFANIAASVLTLLIFGSRYYLFSAVSFSVAMLNLLPIAHLDGGKALYIISDALFKANTSHIFLAVLSDLTVLSILLYSSFRMLKYGDSVPAFLFAISVIFSKIWSESKKGNRILIKGFPRNSEK